MLCFVDVTAGEGVLAVMGPNSRKLAGNCFPDHDWTNDNHPFGTAHQDRTGHGPCPGAPGYLCGRTRLGTYMFPPINAAMLLKRCWRPGRSLDLKLCGMHMMDSCRIEKAFRHFGHDITEEDHVLEAGLGFAVKTAKPDFIGRDAVLAQKRGRAFTCAWCNSN